MGEGVETKDPSSVRAEALTSATLTQWGPKTKAYGPNPRPKIPPKGRNGDDRGRERGLGW